MDIVSINVTFVTIRLFHCYLAIYYLLNVYCLTVLSFLFVFLGQWRVSSCYVWSVLEKVPLSLL